MFGKKPKQDIRPDQVRRLIKAGAAALIARNTPQDDNRTFHRAKSAMEAAARNSTTAEIQAAVEFLEHAIAVGGELRP